LFNFSVEQYLAFLAVLAALYIAVLNFAQGKIGGARNIRAIQAEMRALQMRMNEAAKKRDSAALDAAVSDNMKLTMEMMVVQFKIMAVILALLIPLSFVFPFIEPQMHDDTTHILFDDGLAPHCDTLAGDGTHSSCMAMPANAQKGAWVIDFHLKSSANETVFRNATALYVEGGAPGDIWLQPPQQGGILDIVTGKKPMLMQVSVSKENATLGEELALYATPPHRLSEGERIVAVSNSGTFLYLDLPTTIPLLNIRRIIGSYGIFIFLAFVESILYAIAKSAYGAIRKRITH